MPSDAPLAVLRKKVPTSVCIPGHGQLQLDAEDKDIVYSMGLRAVEFVVQHLPFAITTPDAKKHIPQSVSNLAVSIPNEQGGKAFVGSFDALYRVFHSKGGGVWGPYHLEECAVDFKITSATQPLGLTGATMFSYLSHGRRVLAASKKEGSRISECKVVAWLLLRPAGCDQHGKVRPDANGFVAFDAAEFVKWKPHETTVPPPPLVLSGSLLVRGLGPDEVSLPPARPPPRAVKVNRWSSLQDQATDGMVTLQQFVETFDLAGSQDSKKAAHRVGKRLRENGCETPNSISGKGHRQPKMAKIADLRKHYKQLV